MEDTDKDADLRHPSINTEPRTLNENSIERATLAAQKMYAEHPEPSSDCFIKDAIDAATRENAPAKDAADTFGVQLDAGGLDVQLDELVRNAENLVDTDFTQSKASLPTESSAAASPPPSPRKPST